jgi:two-component system sensor histidine kinase YesM
MNEEPEIDGVVLSLNKLLQYNLGKKNKSATLQEEVDAVKEYMTLQKSRYNFNYDIHIQADSNFMNISMPRFILQPLIENALYHGLKEEGYIHVDIMAAEQVKILIQDNGTGMSEETIQKLLYNEQTQQGNDGMGIGLNYVKRMLEAYFEGKASLEIKSTLGKGTTVILSLPYTGVIS